MEDRSIVSWKLHFTDFRGSNEENRVKKERIMFTAGFKIFDIEVLSTFDKLL